MKSRSGSERTLPAGKIAPELLARLLPSSQTLATVHIGACVGEDAALVEGADPMVVPADPVTFATADVGRYAVAVNCNDLVAMGALPRYFTATLLLPPGSTDGDLATIFAQLSKATDAVGVAWIGGHTEVTDAVRLPVVAGSAIGSLTVDHAWSSGGAQVGDAIVATKWMGLEGSTLLARERAAYCQELGLPVAQLQRWLDDPGIDVVAEGRALSGLPLNAAHDPTEGGFAQGLHEIATASDVGIELDRHVLPIEPATDRLCRAFGIDPLGLLASGSLLFTAAPALAVEALDRLRRAGIRASQIGQVVAGSGVVATGRGPARDIPRFVQDEVVRALLVAGR